MHSTTSAQLFWENRTITENENETDSKEEIPATSRLLSVDFQTQTDQYLDFGYEENLKLKILEDKSTNTDSKIQEKLKGSKLQTKEIALDSKKLPICQK